MAAVLDNLVSVNSEASCPRLQIYNDGTGLVIEYPWFSSEEDEDAGFVRRTFSKVTAAVTQMAPHIRLGMDLVVVGGLVCGSLVGLMTAGPLAMGGVVGSAVTNGFLSGIFC